MDTVPAAGPSLARAAGTVIQVDGAEASSEALRTEAGKAVYAINACGTVGARPHQTVIHIDLTVGTHESCQAAACEVEGKTLVVLALPSIPAWEAEVGVGKTAGVNLLTSVLTTDFTSPPPAAEFQITFKNENKNSQIVWVK